MGFFSFHKLAIDLGTANTVIIRDGKDCCGPTELRNDK